MEDRENQIEGLTEIISGTFSYAKQFYPDKYEPFELNVYPDEIARTLYEAKCRILPEGSEVVTRGELLKIENDCKAFDEFARSISDIRMKNGNKIATFKDLQDYIKLQIEKAKAEAAVEICKKIINEILPKVMYGHNEKALELSIAISNLCIQKKE